MNQKYIIAIDGGTQSTKVSIFDTVGNEVCSHTVKLKPMHLYGECFAEHPDDDLWDSLKEACHSVFAKFQGDKKDIIGVGLGSIRCCRALIQADGNLASPVQSWMDIRLSKPYVHENDKVRYVTTTTGYLTHRLTGETKDTRCNYVGPWPIDYYKLEWMEDKEAFDVYTTPREMLFELVDPSTILGTITPKASEATGIPVGTPVASTSNDKAVEGLGAGLLNNGSVLVSLGTYIAAMMLGDKANQNPQNYWVNPGATPGEWLYESSGIRRGMSTISWVLDLLGGDIVAEANRLGISREAYMNKLAADVPAGSDGLYTLLHWLARPTNPHERGVMMGFSGVHKGPHMFRSVMEGIAMTMKNNVQAMVDEQGITLKSIVVSGGGSNGELFMQIMADVFGVPAVRNVVNGSASMGAAICAALALGVYKTREEAIMQMVQVRDSFQPIPEHVDIYREINENVYRHLADQTDALLRKSHEILTKHHC